MTPQAEPFEIAIPEEKLRDLRERLERINWAPDFANDGWGYGVNGAYLREIAEHWLHRYDWRAQEAEMNRLANFRVEIEGDAHPLRARAGEGAEPDPHHPLARLALDLLGPAPRDRPADRPGGARRRPPPTPSTWSSRRCPATASPRR